MISEFVTCFFQGIEHEELLEWIGGEFDPEVFNPVAATNKMKKGLPDWRNMV